MFNGLNNSYHEINATTLNFVLGPCPSILSMTTTITTMLNLVWFAIVFGLIANSHNAGTYVNCNDAQIHLTLLQFSYLHYLCC